MIASLRSLAVFAFISTAIAIVTLACSDPSNYQGGGRSGSGARQANEVPVNDAATNQPTSDGGVFDSGTNG